MAIQTIDPAEFTDLTAETDQLLSELSNSAPISPVIPSWPWLLAGLGIGLAGGVALALTLTGALG